VARERKLEREAVALDEHDRHGADEGSDGDVDEGVGAPVPWGDAVGHDEGEDTDSEAVEEEAWLDGVFQKLRDSLEVLILRRVEHDY